LVKLNPTTLIAPERVARAYLKLPVEGMNWSVAGAI